MVAMAGGASQLGGPEQAYRVEDAAMAVGDVLSGLLGGEGSISGEGRELQTRPPWWCLRSTGTQRPWWGVGARLRILALGLAHPDAGLRAGGCERSYSISTALRAYASREEEEGRRLTDGA